MTTINDVQDELRRINAALDEVVSGTIPREHVARVGTALYERIRQAKHDFDQTDQSDPARPAVAVELEQTIDRVLKDVFCIEPEAT